MNAIDKMKQNENWLGFGYIGHEMRENPLADKLVLKAIKELKLSDEDAFLFLNSKPGRWLGDSMSFWLDSKKSTKKQKVESIKETIKKELFNLKKELK